MPINQAGLDLIKSYEKCRLTVYDDGRGFATVGWGHRTTLPLGAEVSQEQADAWLAEDLAHAESVVERLVGVPLSDNQRAALVSFAYNVGAAALERSHLLTYVNAEEWEQAAGEFHRWSYSRGERLEGLARRRADEAALFRL